MSGTGFASEKEKVYSSIGAVLVQGASLFSCGGEEEQVKLELVLP